MRDRKLNINFSLAPGKLGPDSHHTCQRVEGCLAPLVQLRLSYASAGRRFTRFVSNREGKAYPQRRMQNIRQRRIRNSGLN